ncbi:sulfur oxidation c-type cytochrome SoxA [Endothiovibrio diazotrophicus]
MIKRLLKVALVGVVALGGVAAQADPAQDLQEFRDFYVKKFPKVPLQEYANGSYALDEVARANWEAIEEFPPYEPFIDAGEAMWNKPFANGKGYADCFGSPDGLKAKYPQWDAKKGMVVTMALALNNCRKANGEKPLKYKKGPINNIMSFLAYKSRGLKTDIKVPNDPGALAAYEKGKQFYYARRGQLNFACSHCHKDYAGQLLRTEILSPGLGHTTGFPVYRSKWGTVGTLHRRFTGCNKQVRAKPFKAQGEEYRDLEYFLTYMSNGIEWNGPSARK